MVILTTIINNHVHKIEVEEIEERQEKVWAVKLAVPFTGSQDSLLPQTVANSAVASLLITSN